MPSSSGILDESADASLVDSLYRISRLMSETDDARQALSVVVDELFRRLPASSASVGLIEPDTGLLNIEVSRGLPPESHNTRLAPGQGITGHVALHGQPLLVNDVTIEPSYVAVRDGVRCEMAAPMVVRSLDTVQVVETVVGVVNVDAETPGAFSEMDLKLLTVLTNEATRVVARLWHLRQLREKTSQLETLIGAGRQLVHKRESARVLEALADDARRLVRCQRCAIFLLEPGESALTLQCISGPGTAPNESERRIDLEDSALGVAVRRRKQVDVHDLAYTEEHHFVDMVQADGLKSMLATPIVFEREVLGVLNVYTDRRHRFSNDERRLMQSLASLGAAALQNARLYARVFASEEAVRKNERLTTLGMLSAEIAHEIRNPLTVIKLLFDSLDLEFPHDDPRTQDVAVIAERINHLEEIVGRVLEFGRSRTGLHARYNLSSLVDETLVLLRPKLEQTKITAQVHHGSAKVLIDAHKGQIQQVLLNLTMNAVQAMPDGGSLIIRSGILPGVRSQVASVEIEDSGHGIPEHIRGRIFESFLTGRPEGTGLGLAISKQIMKAHQGELELLSTGENGTCFRFSLPIASFE